MGLRYWKVRWVTLSTDRELVVLSAVQWRFGLCGPGFYGYLILWIPLWCSKLTTIATATTTATATAERLFEALRVYCLVILSTDRGLVVLRFCGGAEKVLSMGDLWVPSAGL